MVKAEYLQPIAQWMSCKAHCGEASCPVFASSGYRKNVMKSEGGFLTTPSGWGSLYLNDDNRHFSGNH